MSPRLAPWSASWRLAHRFQALPNSLFSAPPNKWLQGELEPWHLMRLAEEARLVNIVGRSSTMLNHRDLLPKGSMVFTSRARLQYRPAFWSIRPGDSLDCSTTIPFFGRTSFVIRQVLNAPQRVEGDVVLDLQLVTVDGSTHRPVPHVANGQVPRVPADLFSSWVPLQGDFLYEHLVVVRASDCDAYGHVNHSSFLQFACEAVRAAVDEKRLPAWPSGWFAGPKLENISCVWLAELLPRMQVCVRVWQRHVQPLTVAVEVFSSDCNTAAFRADLQYSM